MKDKIKRSLTNFTIIYIITITILAFISYFSFQDEIEIGNNNDSFNEKITFYKSEINQLKDNNCKEYLKTLVNFVENDNKERNIKVRDYYQELEKESNKDQSIIYYYVKAKENCPMINDKINDEYDLTSLFLTAHMQSENIFKDYYFKYEIGIKDIANSEVMPNTLVINQNIKASAESRIINNLIEIIKNSEVLDEE